MSFHLFGYYFFNINLCLFIDIDMVHFCSIVFIRHMHLLIVFTTSHLQFKNLNICMFFGRTSGRTNEEIKCK